MNIKILPSLAAALVVTSLAHPAFAQSLGEHPAVLVARMWGSRGIDPNTFIVAHPAGVRWINESPTTKDKAPRSTQPMASRAVHSRQNCWSRFRGGGRSASNEAESSR
jgi:hypothetical protein